MCYFNKPKSWTQWLGVRVYHPKRSWTKSFYAVRFLRYINEDYCSRGFKRQQLKTYSVMHWTGKMGFACRICIIPVISFVLTSPTSFFMTFLAFEKLSPPIMSVFLHGCLLNVTFAKLKLSPQTKPIFGTLSFHFYENKSLWKRI